MKKITLVVVCFLFFACQKNEVIQTGLIGVWHISKIDSVKTSPFEETVFFLENITEIGDITFSEDSSGYFDHTIREITCGEKEFAWSYEYDPNEALPFDGRKYIKLVFNNGISYTSHYYQISNDSIDFFLMAYCGDHIGGIGKPLYYRFDLIRK